MIGAIVWCFINVTIDNEPLETAAKGKVVDKVESALLVDFSEYATKQGYQGYYKRIIVNEDSCINE